MIKAVIFDCFGVLTTDTWRVFMESLPPETDAEAARQAHRAYNSGLLSKQECAERIRTATGGRTFIELDDLDSAVAANLTRNKPLLNYISDLHARGFKISILSNVGSNWIREQLLSPEEQTWIDDFVFSYEVHLIKPDERMYRLACDRLHIQPTEALFVDDKEPYCAAARAVGLHAVCYQDFAQAKHDIDQCLLD
jgi:epoxide hydrolase-like predicted phosphatase